MPHRTSHPLHYAADYKDVVSRLEILPRTGWVQWKVKDPETVWEHILAVRRLAITYKDNLNLNEDEFRELLDMIEIHDWPEAQVGDGVILGDEPNVVKLRNEKKKREMEAMERICSNAPHGQKIIALYIRYASGNDHIARLVKQLEKLQAVFKASEYERTQSKKGLTAEFAHYTRDLLHDTFLTSEFEKIVTTLMILLLISNYVSPTLFYVVK